MPSSNVAWGIDIGAGAVKGIKLERDGDNVKVLDFIVVPHKKVLSTPDIDAADATRIALGSFVARAGDALKNCSIAVSVPGHMAFARFATLPPVEPKRVASLVQFEAAQQIPFPIAEVEWDYQLFTSPDSPDVEVGIFAMTRDRVNEKLSLWGDAGLTPDIISLSPLAAFNALAYDLAFTASTPGTVILDIGAQATDLIVAEGGRVWIRTFPLGGHNFTEAIAATFKLSYSKAEKLKREAETSKYKRHIFQSMKPVLQDLAQDVQRSISYYTDNHKDAKITRLIGLGSTFRVLGLRKMLSQTLKMDVYRLEQFKRISVEGAGASDFAAVTGQMATAYGLALQGLGLAPIKANLMPVAVIRAALWKRKTPHFVAAAAIAALAGGVSFLRPFLDSSDITPIKDDPNIRKVIDQGEKLKSEWQKIAEQNRPSFAVENVLQLFEGRDLYAYFLKDVDEMFAEANRRPGAVSDVSPFAFELRSLNTDYLAPGTLLVPAGPSADGSRPPGGFFDPPPDRRSGGGKKKGADEEAPTDDDPTRAGPLGAVRITLVVDSQHEDGITFVNDTLLHWLRANIDRPDRPYTLAGLPTVDGVQWGEVSEDTSRPAQGSPRPPAPRPPGTSPGFDERGGAAPPDTGGLGFGGGAPEPDPGSGGVSKPSRQGGGPGIGEPERPGGQPASRGRGSEVTQLEAIAPLPPAPVRLDPEKKTMRYTITWFARIKPAVPSGATEGAREQASTPRNDPRPAPARREEV